MSQHFLLQIYEYLKFLIVECWTPESSDEPTVYHYPHHCATSICMSRTPWKSCSSWGGAVGRMWKLPPNLSPDQKTGVRCPLCHNTTEQHSILLTNTLHYHPTLNTTVQHLILDTTVQHLTLDTTSQHLTYCPTLNTWHYFPTLNILSNT